MAKTETVPVHVIKTHTVSRGIATLFPNLVNLTIRQLYPGKITPVPTEEEARRSELSSPAWNRTPDRPGCSLIAIPAVILFNSALFRYVTSQCNGQQSCLVLQLAPGPDTRTTVSLTLQKEENIWEKFIAPAVLEML
jgi:hypothetical protein